MRKLIEKDTKKEMKRKRRRATKSKFQPGEARQLVHNIVRLSKTIDTLYNQINTLSANLKELTSQYDGYIHELITSGDFYISLADLKTILGEQFEELLPDLLDFAKHVRVIKDPEIHPEVYVFIRDDGSFVVYTDKDSIPADLRGQVVSKRVVIW